MKNVHLVNLKLPIAHLEVALSVETIALNVKKVTFVKIAKMATLVIYVLNATNNVKRVLTFGILVV